MRRLFIGFVLCCGCDSKMGGADGAVPDSGPPDLAVEAVRDLAMVDGGAFDLAIADAADASARTKALAFHHSAGVPLGGPGASAYYTLPGDFNGDGRADFLIGYNAQRDLAVLNGWRVWLTDGKGGFDKEGPTTQWSGFIPLLVTIADFDGDKRSDVLVSDSDRGTRIELSNGDGTFTADVIDAAHGLTVALDADGDGRMDFARTAINNGAPVIQVFTNAGGGKLAQKSQVIATAGIVALATGDVNGDQRADILYLAKGNNGYVMQALLGNGDGTFTVAAGTVTFTSPPCVSVGDFNGDHVSDVATGAGVFLGRGDGTFNAIIPTAITWCPSAGDFDLDGNLDLLVPAPKGFAIFAGKGDGTFNAAVTFPLLKVDPDGAFAVDLDGDGQKDVATIAPDFESRDLDLFLNASK